MPLRIYQRDSAGNILYTKNETGFDVAIMHSVDLPYEMTESDFEPSSSNWLDLTFDEQQLWHDESPKCLNMLGRMAVFLSEKTFGPYYVHENLHNTRSTYGVVLLDARDVEAFAAEFPQWKFDKQSHQQNILEIQNGLKNGWRPQSQRLQNFCMMNGLRAPSASAPSGPS